MNDEVSFISAVTLPIAGDPSLDDGPVRVHFSTATVVEPPLAGPTKTEPSTVTTAAGSGEAGPVAQPPSGPTRARRKGPRGPQRNPTHARKDDRSHAHDHWHYAKTPKSHLPADVSDQWWRETKAMIDRGYDRFIRRHHLNRHSPEWSISNWGVCAGVTFNEKP